MLTRKQTSLAHSPLDSFIFLEGPAGAGKTTTGVERLCWLIEQGAPGSTILLLLPQRTLAEPYTAVLQDPRAAAGGLPAVLTVGGLARRVVELFWPLAAGRAGFSHPQQAPVFLTLETAQYYMARLVRPLLDEGCFEGVALDRNRLYSQILDNLNKAAAIGFPYTEIGSRLKAAWVGEDSRRRVYDDAQACATVFRQYCLEHNLLDFSLQLEIFMQHLWPDPTCRNYLVGTYRHLILDNLEEDTPRAHDLLRDWLPGFDSALLIYDCDAGYRSFMGADPHSAYALRDVCQQVMTFNDSFVASPPMQAFEAALGQALRRPGQAQAAVRRSQPQRINLALEYDSRRYYPEMLDWVAGRIASLVHEGGVPPGEIVALAPFLTDSLRFSLSNRLDQRGIPVRSHRPSRALREEPATQCLLTLASLAHPGWGIQLTSFDVAYALLQAIDEIDLVRAQLLASIVFRPRQEAFKLGSFETIKPDVQQRITYELGNRYEALRGWLFDYAQNPAPELDLFLSRLFGEVLSQPGYRFHHNFTAGEVAANLVDSAASFRWVVSENEAAQDNPGKPLGQEYMEMVQEGVVAAQYIRSWQAAAENAVLLAPAYTFLLSNHPVEVQFWLDASSNAWFERLYQPLTHPYVLSRNWPEGAIWTDVEEFEANQETLYRVTLGLARRCRRKIYLGLSDLNEQGYDHTGPLLKAIQRVLRSNQ